MTLLLNGDCIEQLKQVGDDSVDLIFCDLPYGQTSCKWDIIIPWEPLWAELMRVKKLHTPLFFTTTTKFGVEIITSAPKKCPFRYDIVWAKSAPCGFLSAKKMPMRKHEMIYVFYEKLPFYDLSSHQQTVVETKQTKSKNVSMSEKQDCYVKNKTNDDLREGFRDSKYDPPLPTSMLEVKSTRGKHSTEKPVALIEWILKYYSKEGDVVLDPTMGSGSTGVACKKMKRNFIGIEKDEEIFQIACQRLEECV